MMKGAVGSVQSMPVNQMVVEEPNCPFGALANKTLGHVARRKMLMHARLKANSSPNIR